MVKALHILRRFAVPLAAVLAVAVQAFAITFSAGRSDGAEATPSQDTVIYDNSKIYTRFRKASERKYGSDTSFFGPGSSEKFLSARDTMKAPDSLKLTDPFRYKYFVALNDSLTHRQVRDSLIAAGDSLWHRLDSIYFADSAVRARLAFEKWYNSLTRAERKAYDIKVRNKIKQKQLDSIFHIKDSLKARRDSILQNTPRILETYALPKEMLYKRIIAWNRSSLFSDVRLRQIDTTADWWFNDYPFMRNDINASYLGVIGSPVQTFDFFKRRPAEGVGFYAPYEAYCPGPSTLPMYNTKTPYTELAYWGTLFANTEREESDIHLLVSQNIFPELNISLLYDRFGSNGMLENESTDNRVFMAWGNWLGKRYAAHFGYINNSVKRKENGGVNDTFWIRDTTVGSREIDVNLSNAASMVKKKTFLLDQNYRIPFTFINKIINRKELRREKFLRDSIMATKDSAAIRAFNEEIALKEARRKEIADSIGNDITTASIGHSSEYSVYSRRYTDASDGALTDAYYGGVHYINPAQSRDSAGVTKLENKVFLKLQPWARDALLSDIKAGVGNRILSYRTFSENAYLSPVRNTVWNSTYLYGGASGRLKSSISWNAEAWYTFLGEQSGDTGISADASVSFFPFRRFRSSPVEIGASFRTTLEEAEYFDKHFYSNRLRWDNSFSKISTTAIEGNVNVPLWKFKASAGYSLLKDNIYYGTDAMPHQNGSPMSVLKAGLEKDFSLWLMHFDNKGLFQLSSDESVVPLPKLALNLKWYLQLDVVKDVLKMQLGANALYTNKYYAPAYNPATGLFHNQKDEKFGGCPYIDAFVNMQWKKASIFIKIVNANMGWPNDSADYFSAAGYIRPQRAIKFGIWWPFYTSPNKNESASSKAGGPLGGASSGGGGGLSSGLGSLRSGIGGALR